MPKLLKLYQNYQNWFIFYKAESFGIYTSIFAKTDRYIFKNTSIFAKTVKKSIDLYYRKILKDWHYLFSMWPLWTLWLCLFKSPAWEKDLPQELHLWSLYPSRTVCRCLSKCVMNWMIYHKRHICNLCCLHELYEYVFKALACVNDLPQESHL